MDVLWGVYDEGVLTIRLPVGDPELELAAAQEQAGQAVADYWPTREG